MIEKKWVFKDFDREKVMSMSENMGISPLVAVVLYNRGMIEEEKIKKFLSCDTNLLHDPFSMKGMDAAVERIKQALANKEKITIYGDYDADGITSIVILHKYLKSVGAIVDYYIPNRIEEGYGVSCSALDKFAAAGTNLVITVDTGVTAFDEAKYASRIGLDMVITDHHECKDTLPKVCALIDPKRSDCNYPFKDLAGVGVTFKLIQALNDKVSLAQLIDIYSDMVCLGTVADIAPLVDENRILVMLGLQRFRKTKSIGLRALLNISVSEQRSITASMIGYNIAPKINASGRLGRANRSVELFLSEDEKLAAELAKSLCEDNLLRQQIEQKMLNEALEYIETHKEILNNDILVIPHEGWNHGIVGVVSSKITEKFYKPSLLFAVEGDIARGSGRSVEGFNLFKALEKVSDLLEKYGGHELAAGFTIKMSQLSEFDKKINSLAKGEFSEKNFVPTINIDAKIKPAYINADTVRSLNILQPFGIENTIPVFAVVNAKIRRISTMSDKRHLRLTLQKDNIYLDAIGFGNGHYTDSLKIDDIVDVAFSLDINLYKKVEKAQLIIKHIIKHNASAHSA